MQQRVNDKTARVIQKRRSELNLQMQKKVEESDAPTRNYNPLESVTCKIGDNACAAKHVSAIQRTGVLHPKNESGRVQSLTKLQRQYGNRFVQRVIARHAIQTKLKISQPGDIYEQEADRVAEQVTRMPESQIQQQPEEEEEEPVQFKLLAKQITPLVQRQVEEEEEEELQAKELPDQTLEASSNLEARINAIRSGGQPLPVSTRAFFEPRFGYDFSQVRVHTDTQAAEAARAVNARAFTLGRDIVFGTGQYAPGTMVGKRLMAHELTHTIQQKGGISNALLNSIEKVTGSVSHETIRRAAPPPPAKPALKKSTVRGPIAGNCGGYEWVVQWELDKPTTKGGWVIQRVDDVFNVKDCKTPSSPVDVKTAVGIDPAWFPFWEAWKINKNQKVTTYAEGGDIEDDTYDLGGFTGDTEGGEEIKGTAEFYEGLALPSSFKITNKPPAGILPMTKSKPSLKGGTGPIPHTLSVSWECCPGSKSRKTKIDGTK